MANRCIIVLIAALAMSFASGSNTMAAEPAITTYGEKNAQAPSQLNLFSFLVGKWKGAGEARQADGKVAQFELTWIGRYVLDGMAIADEAHGSFPDGRPYLGITLRQFDTTRDSWVVEFLNVSMSFLRRQVNPRSGSVSQSASTIVVVSEDGPKRIRERYRLDDPSHFTYTLDGSSDGGKSWDPVLFEITLMRVE
jgi:hypothetical protein